MDNERNRKDADRGPRAGSDRNRLMLLSARFLIPIAEKVGVILCAIFLFRFYMPFLIAWGIALLIHPLVHFLERKFRISKTYGSLALIGTVLAAVFWLLWRIALRAYQLFFWAQGQFPEFAEKIPNQFRSPALEIRKVLSVFPDALVYTVVILVGSYLFLIHYDSCIAFLKKHMPKRLTAYGVFLKSEAGHLIGGYFLAQFMIMIVVLVVLFAGFLILKVKWAILLAFLIAFLDFLPVFGTGTALLPWAVFSFLQNDYRMAVGCVVLWAVTQFLRQLIQPKVVGDTMGLSPLMTLFLLFTGYRVCGIGGMILAVPIGILVGEFWKHGFFDREREAFRELREEWRRILRSEPESSMDPGQSSNSDPEKQEDEGNDDIPSDYKRDEEMKY
ncbi:AI-2E family transporter [[Clostridium] aminophilum]|uniref:AI-2E family transporter n=1 Tax=[Clostridium] aminophilum TaxID=1526 RepID=UPI0026EBA1AE|nr:AI-2E family transporter [[Clostridium] aminophilum]MDD6196524.1 AI-2E family transporter [[Clostridium] aminophilum]